MEYIPNSGTPNKNVSVWWNCPVQTNKANKPNIIVKDLLEKNTYCCWSFGCDKERNTTTNQQNP